MSDIVKWLRSQERVHRSRGSTNNANRCSETVDEIERLQGEVAQAKAKHADILHLMDGIRDEASNRNPDGVTILDFMTVWNEQYEIRIVRQQAEIERLSTPDWFIDADMGEDGYSESIPMALELYDPGDVVQLQPMHNEHSMPLVYVLRGESANSYKTFLTAEAAEAAKGGDS